MQAALTILAALIERQQTGTGSTVDVSIGAAADAWAMFPTTAELQKACYTLYETADHQWLALGALEPKFWRAFCERIGRADLIPLQHTAGAEGERVLHEIRAVMQTRTLDDWLSHFSGVDACLTRVAPHAMAGENTSARGGVATAPALGVDTDAVLDAAGFDAARRQLLRRSGVI